MILETSVGPVDASHLAIQETTQRLACGDLKTKSFYLGGVLVKQDQHIDVDPGILPPVTGETATLV